MWIQDLAEAAQAWGQMSGYGVRRPPPRWEQIAETHSLGSSRKCSMEVSGPTWPPSLDVIYHLVEDRVFEEYMRALVGAAHRYVIIYASNSDDNREYQGPHIQHRKFSTWLERNALDGELLEHIPNRYPYRGDYTEGSFAEFFIYGRANAK